MAYGLRGKEVEVEVGETYSLADFFEVYNYGGSEENWSFANVQVYYVSRSDGTLIGNEHVRVSGGVWSDNLGNGSYSHYGNAVFAGTTTWPNSMSLSSVSVSFLEGYTGGFTVDFSGGDASIELYNAGNYYDSGGVNFLGETIYDAGSVNISMPTITFSDEPTLSIAPLGGSRLEVIEGKTSGFEVTLSKAVDHPITVHLNLEYGGLREEVSVVESFTIRPGVTKFTYEGIKGLSDNQLEDTFIGKLTLTATGRAGKAVKFEGGLVSAETEEASLDLHIRDSVIAGYDGQSDVARGVSIAKDVLSYREELLDAAQQAQFLNDPDGYIKALGKATKVAGNVLNAAAAAVRISEFESSLNKIQRDFAANAINEDTKNLLERRAYSKAAVDILDDVGSALFTSASTIAGVGAAGFTAGFIVGLFAITSPVAIPVAVVAIGAAGVGSAILGGKLWSEFQQDWRDRCATILEQNYVEPVRLPDQSLLEVDGGNWIYTSKASSVTAASGTVGTDHVFYDGSGTLKLASNIENATLLDPGSVGDSFALMKAASGASVLGNKLKNELTGNSLANTLSGEGGTDSLMGGGGKDQLDGGTGKDTADYSDKSVSVKAALEGANETTVRVAGKAEDILVNIENLIGGSAGDSLSGDERGNKLSGNEGGDKLWGLDGKDSLDGGWGRDKIVGGAGRDILSGGFDYEKDVFIFAELQDSAAGKRHDVIQDFLSRTDVIDLRGIDANTSSKGDDDFHVAKGAKAYSVWWTAKGDDLLLQADVTGDKKADFEILLQDAASMYRGDLLL